MLVLGPAGASLRVFDTIIRFRNESPIGLSEQMKAVKGSFEVFKNIVKEGGHCSTGHARRRMTIMQTALAAMGFCENIEVTLGLTAAEHL